MENLHKSFTLTYSKVLDLDGKRDYLYRWSLWLPFGLSLKVHKIVRSDNDRCEHNHPWWFIRIILYGGYAEQIKGKTYSRLPWRPWAFWRIYPCLPSFQHKILRLFKRSNWSLVLCGRNKGSWGFLTKDGWVPWRQFLEIARATKDTVVLWCDDLWELKK